MAITIPKFMYPRFYMKKAGDSFSLHHRLTHSYIGNFYTEEEVREEIERYNNMTEYELWEDLLNSKQVRIPKQNGMDVNQIGKDSEEEWFLSAWSFFTDNFYERFPKLLVEVDSIPYDIIHNIRKLKYDAEVLASKELENEKREAEKVWLEQERYRERNKAGQDRIIKSVEGKIGNRVAMEQMVNKKKRLKKKVKVQTPSTKVIEFEDSDDLFA